MGGPVLTRAPSERRGLEAARGRARDARDIERVRGRRASTSSITSPVVALPSPRCARRSTDRSPARAPGARRSPQAVGARCPSPCGASPPRTPAAAAAHRRAGADPRRDLQQPVLGAGQPRLRCRWRAARQPELDRARGSIHEDPRVRLRRGLPQHARRRVRLAVVVLLRPVHPRRPDQDEQHGGPERRCRRQRQAACPNRSRRGSSVRTLRAAVPRGGRGQRLRRRSDLEWAPLRIRAGEQYVYGPWVVHFYGANAAMGRQARPREPSTPAARFPTTPSIRTCRSRAPAIAGSRRPRRPFDLRDLRRHRRSDHDRRAERVNVDAGWRDLRGGSRHNQVEVEWRPRTATSR